MSSTDHRGCPATGAGPAALEDYERALGRFVDWRSGAEAPLAAALQQAPRFVMAHVLQAWMRICSRDPQRVRSARAVLAQAAALPAHAHERGHLGAIEAALDDDFDRARARLGGLLRERPRDLLALHAVHALDHVTGDATRLRQHVDAVLPAWSADLPGYAAVLAMQAFGLEESGRCAHAEEAARAALARCPQLPRAHHVMAHVFEMTGRADEGARWLAGHADAWSVDSVVATHGWWHQALFHLTLGQTDRALALYDQRVRASHSDAVADLIDASALLWRIELRGGAPGNRWAELAAAWAPHIDDAYCSFSDLHAMLAFVGARDWDRAARFECTLARAQAQPTRHGRTTRQLGLPAGRALIAFGRGHFGVAIALLATLRPQAHRLGGSQAQRDVLQLTLRRAVERFGRPGRRRRDGVPVVAPA